ncbi:flagellar filament capping protein FliD [Novosphingobium ginsenosidimutans]|uniref:Flagellar hook-associated protein 2 n=1 Tax=Novosphingobium ginsenosidimutans TaxID=1176536 RepID=A0A5B8S4H8_9SPHN|nr:flagellar filament capping protein FliD [Novosphingobium ginsenosidimutans]QEA16320.1 flagellar hook protein [Novosphingobium ginsenosidimutans]
MVTTSATSSIVTALGGGSGIDMAALARNLSEAQFSGRLARIDSSSELLERQISTASTLKNQVTQLATSIGDRVRTGDLSSQPIIANGAVASVSRGAVSGSGSYSLEVTALAASQTLVSPAVASAGTAIGAGTLTLRFGTIAGGTFTADPARTDTTVTLAPGATLADAAAAINAANAGVTAYIAEGANGAQLVLKGSEGAANAFVLEASEDPGNPGLATLAWNGTPDPARQIAAAADAAFKLDGVAMTSKTNVIENVVPGLSLRLTGTNTGAPTSIRFSDPGSAVSTFMQDLTAALNELVATLNEAINPQGGDLARDSGARALRSALSQLASTTIMPSAATGQPRTLGELGLATNRDGTFRFDTARLTAVSKASPNGVTNMFTTGIHGVFATIDRLARNASTASNPGSLGGSLARFTAKKTDLTEERSALAEAQETLRAQLTKRFAAADSRVGTSRSTLSFLQGQIDAWNAGRN